MELLLWQNLIFLLPLLLAVFYLLVLATGGDGDGHHDADGHHHGGHDGNHDSDLGKVLALFGIGRVPLSLFLTTLCVVWGGAGLITNQVVGMKAWMISVTVAALAAVVLTQFISIGIGRLIQTKSYGVDRQDLINHKGRTTMRTSSTMGEVRLIDRSGTLRDVSARVAPDQPDIPENTDVVLASYDSAAGVFTVARAQN